MGPTVMTVTVTHQRYPRPVQHVTDERAAVDGERQSTPHLVYEEGRRHPW